MTNDDIDKLLKYASGVFISLDPMRHDATKSSLHSIESKLYALLIIVSEIAKRLPEKETKK